MKKHNLTVILTLLVLVGTIALAAYVIGAGDLSSGKACWQLLSCVFAGISLLVNVLFVPEMYPEVQARFRRWVNGVTIISIVSGILSLLL